MKFFIQLFCLAILSPNLSCNEAQMTGSAAKRKSKSIYQQGEDAFGDNTDEGVDIDDEISPADQADLNGDNVPDFKEDRNNNGIADGKEDPDGDGIPTEKDNAPNNPNPDQKLPGDMIFGACVDDSKLPILADVYRMPSGSKRLPDFNTLRKQSTVCLEEYNIPERDWKRGFPGLSQEFVEWFGLSTKTTLIVEEEGQHKFYLASDDGSKLKIDGKLIIDNDGEHGRRERSGSVELTKGEHLVELDYFQGPKYKIALQLYWKTPSNGDKRIVPQSSFKYTK